MGNVKIPYYVVVKGRGYWRPKSKMRALGFERVNCGKDGPSAWAIAETWARRWAQAQRGDYVCAPSDFSKTYPAGSIGESFQRTPDVRMGQKGCAHARGLGTGLAAPRAITRRYPSVHDLPRGHERDPRGHRGAHFPTGGAPGYQDLAGALEGCRSHGLLRS
jgi:hypothetical protein